MGNCCETKNNNPQKENNAFHQGPIDNYILAEIDIKDDDVNKDIRIIDSYEEYYKYWDFRQFNEEKSNEEEIEQCEITINNQLIPFSYFYNFKSKGKYTIKYSFKNILTRTNCMFYECQYLTKLDFSHFNSKNVSTMEFMFSDCVSLTDINFSNFNTQNVTNMNSMFFGCQSLTTLDLSSFDTKKVTIMYCMFEGCKSLTHLNLSNFNTQSVELFDMEDMFEDCDSLLNQNIICNAEKLKYVIQFWK